MLLAGLSRPRQKLFRPMSLLSLRMHKDLSKVENQRNNNSKKLCVHLKPNRTCPTRPLTPPNRPLDGSDCTPAFPICETDEQNFKRHTNTLKRHSPRTAADDFVNSLECYSFRRSHQKRREGNAQ